MLLILEKILVLKQNSILNKNDLKSQYLRIHNMKNSLIECLYVLAFIVWDVLVDCIYVYHGKLTSWF